ncbi:MAG: hypothetical protein SGPRY_008026 [Prymnesium sp.]
MPAARGWDCYPHERIDMIDISFRSPCLCKPDVPVYWLDEVILALIWGALISFILFLVGSSLDANCGTGRVCACRPPAPRGSSYMPLGGMGTPRGTVGPYRSSIGPITDGKQTPSPSKHFCGGSIVSWVMLVAEVTTSIWLLSDFWLNHTTAVFVGGLMTVGLTLAGLSVHFDVRQCRRDKGAADEVAINIKSEAALRRGAILLSPKMYLMLLIVVNQGLWNTVLAVIPFLSGDSSHLIAAYKIDVRVVALSLVISLVTFSITAMQVFRRFSKRSPFTRGMAVGLFVYMCSDFFLRALSISVLSAALDPYSPFILSAVAAVFIAIKMKFEFRTITGPKERFLQFLDAICGLLVPSSLSTPATKLFPFPQKRSSQSTKDLKCCDCRGIDVFGLTKETAITSLLWLCLGILGLWQGLPNPHHDRDFAVLVVRVLIASIFVKTFAWFGCVVPVISDTYKDIFTCGLHVCDCCCPSSDLDADVDAEAKVEMLY